MFSGVLGDFEFYLGLAKTLHAKSKIIVDFWKIIVIQRVFPNCFCILAFLPKDLYPSNFPGSDFERLNFHQKIIHVGKVYNSVQVVIKLSILLKCTYQVDRKYVMEDLDTAGSCLLEVSLNQCLIQ